MSKPNAPRIADLERELRLKDKRISELKDEIDEIRELDELLEYLEYFPLIVDARKLAI